MIDNVFQEGKKVLIAAHGNSLRALVKYLDNMSDDDIMGLNIPTGCSLVFIPFFSRSHGIHAAVLR